MSQAPDTGFVGFEKNDNGDLFFRAGHNKDWIAMPRDIGLEGRIRFDECFRVLKVKGYHGTAMEFYQQIKESDGFCFERPTLNRTKEG